MTMGDIARCSVGRASDYYNEDLLYRMFGVNAELLIDHAWGWEPCEIADIRSYEPGAHSISSGQVLTGPADYATARLITNCLLYTSVTFLSTDMWGKRLNCWNTTPIRARILSWSARGSVTVSYTHL